MAQPVALVTGGAVRVGRAISLALSAAGNRLVVNYNRSSEAADSLIEELRRNGAEAIAVRADVSVRAESDELLSRATTEYGRLDVVVNNAAIFDERSFLDVDEGLWSRTLQVNLTAPFNVAQAAARIMLAAGGGRIINICGTAGVSPIGDYAPYCVAKAGLDMLTRCMAQTLAPTIQVNGVAPGTVLFPEGTSEDQRRRVTAQIPAGAIGAPEDVAGAVCFLARAPDYLTGSIITVDGGASLGVGMSGGGWDNPPFLIAHRGFSSLAPENTLIAFERALDAGADVLECDVQLSADGVAVVLHDPKVDRTTDGRGAVRELTWSRIRGLDAGYAARFAGAFAGQRVPRLEDLLDLAKGRASVFVEIKPEALAGTTGGVEVSLVDAARRTGMMNAVGVLSFAPQALTRVGELAPGFPLGLVFRWWRQRRLVEEAAVIGADYLVGYAPRVLADPAIVGRAHAAGLRVGAYVADTIEVVSGLVGCGVDGIATNCVGDLLPSFVELKGS